MAMIAGKAGLSTGIVNFHFDSKQKLYEETIVYLAQEHHDKWFREYSNAGLSAAEKLLAIADAHFHAKICTPGKLAVWYAFFGEARRRAVYRDLIDRIDTRRFALSLQLCEEICRDGGYTSVNARVVAQTLEVMYDGFCLHILMYPRDLTRKDARAQIRTYLATVFPDHFTAP